MSRCLEQPRGTGLTSFLTVIVVLRPRPPITHQLHFSETGTVGALRGRGGWGGMLSGNMGCAGKVCCTEFFPNTEVTSLSFLLGSTMDRGNHTYQKPRKLVCFNLEGGWLDSNPAHTGTLGGVLSALRRPGCPHLHRAMLQLNVA